MEWLTKKYFKIIQDDLADEPNLLESIKLPVIKKHSDIQAILQEPPINDPPIITVAAAS